MERIGIKEFYRKILDSIKGRVKKKCKWNWPELDTYCGCCNLTTGIYIRSAIALLVTVITIVCNGTILSYILEIRPIVLSTNVTSVENVLNRTNPEEDLSKLRLIYNAILAYYILWLSFKAIYVFILLWTIFAIFKRNGKMMKILLYISVPNWILDIFISLLAALIIKFNIRILLVFCILSEGYNILAMNSEYKKMMGKARLRHEDVESEPGTPSMPPFISPPHRDIRYGYNQLHCRGCNCTANEPPDNENGVVSIQPSADPVQTTPIPNKEIGENELNYAITGVLSPINVDDTNETTGNASSPRAVRPTTLDLNLSMVKDEKVVVTDEPVIYDENQLNVGTSPVIENREA